MFSALAVQHLLRRPVGEERQEGADDRLEDHLAQLLDDVQFGAETHEIHRGRPEEVRAD
jgi:hypothetical protein